MTADPAQRGRTIELGGQDVTEYADQRMVAPLTPGRATADGLFGAVSTRTAGAETSSLNLPAETAAFSSADTAEQ